MFVLKSKYTKMKAIAGMYQEKVKILTSENHGLRSRVVQLEAENKSLGKNDARDAKGRFKKSES